MSELTLTLLRLGFLVLLWVLVLAILGVLRRDLFGTRIVRRSPRPAAAGTQAGTQAGPPAAAAAAAGRRNRPQPEARPACAPWS